MPTSVSSLKLLFADARSAQLQRAVRQLSSESSENSGPCGRLQRLYDSLPLAAGYYYDASSGYYYDANSGLYYDSASQRWLAMDAATGEFAPYPAAAAAAAPPADGSISTAAQAAAGAARPRCLRLTVHLGLPCRARGLLAVLCCSSCTHLHARSLCLFTWPEAACLRMTRQRAPSHEEAVRQASRVSFEHGGARAQRRRARRSRSRRPLRWRSCMRRRWRTSPGRRPRAGAARSSAPRRS